MGLFRAIILILFTGLFFYVTHQLTRFADFSFATNVAVISLMLLLFGLVLAMPLFFWSANRTLHRPWHDTYFFLAHSALGYINFLIAFIILRDIFSFIYFYAVPDSPTEAWYNATGTGVMLTLPLVFLFIGTLVVRSGPRLKKLNLQFPHLPADLEGIKILHVTDLHIGRSLPSRFVQKLLRLSEKHPADLVVFTGDILDDLPSRFQNDLHLLRKMPTVHGHFFVPGNHEYYWEGSHTIEAFRKLGFHVLTNECHSLSIGAASLQICGVPDPAARMFNMESPDFEKLRVALAPQAFKVLLSHQPVLADKAAPLGVNLQLSGHTHGGQFFPWNFLIGFFQKYGKGLYYIQELQLYVNQGTGYWGPSLRLGTYCEVAEITLRSKK